MSGENKNVRDLLRDIKIKSDDIIGKLETLNLAEKDSQVIEEELKRIKKKLDDEEISKFSYATMLEVNVNRSKENTELKKKTWEDISSNVNNINTLLGDLKELYNKKTEVSGAPEIEEKKNEEE